MDRAREVAPFVGDAQDVISPQAGLAGLERAQLRRNVGLGGLAFHASQKLSVTADVEASSSYTYFRTSLRDTSRPAGTY